jgi:hypothetical protein
MDQTLNVGPNIPAGATVYVYPRSSDLLINGQPPGSPLGSAVADANSSVTLSGLSERTWYWAAALVAGSWRSIVFRTPAADGIEGPPEGVWSRVGAVEALALAHEPRLDSVESSGITANGDQAGTTGAPTPKTIWSFQPVDTAKGPFQWVIGGASFNGTWDTVMFLGYNVADGGGNALASEPSFRWCIEQDYNDGSKRLIESYWEYRNAAGTVQKRPIMLQFNRATDANEQFELRGTTFTFTDWTAGTAFANWSKSGLSLLAFTGVDQTLAIGAAAGRSSALQMHYNAGVTPAIQWLPSSQTGTIMRVDWDAVFAFYKSGGGARMSIGAEFNDAALTIQDQGGGYALTTRDGPSGQAQDHYRATNAAASTVYSRFNPAGYFMTRKTAAPADGDLANGEGAIWWDATPGTGGFRYKGKASNGTILSGSL